MRFWKEAMIVFVKWSLGGKQGTMQFWISLLSKRNVSEILKSHRNTNDNRISFGLPWECMNVEEHKTHEIKITDQRWSACKSHILYATLNPICDNETPVLQNTRMRVGRERGFPCSVFAVWIICTSDTDSDKCVQGNPCVLPYWCWGNGLSLFIKSIMTHTKTQASSFSLAHSRSTIIVSPMQVQLYLCVDIVCVSLNLSIICVPQTVFVAIPHVL